MAPTPEEPSIKNQTTSKYTEYFEGFYYRPKLIQNIKSFQKHFEALDTDIILTSKPKSGTTWLKSLIFSIVNRNRCSPLESPLTNANAHALVPAFEYNLYKNNEVPDMVFPSPRLFATHTPYSSLPESIKSSNCKIVYVARNPCDVLVSLWHFLKDPKMITFEECYQMFCRGEEPFGPYWNHILEYWNESLNRPNKVLFIKYEELKEDPVTQLKRLAQFIGFPFNKLEEEMGVIQNILQLCSFENLKNLKINQEGKDLNSVRDNKTFFRKGKVGDSVNYLSPSAIESLNKIVEEKLSGSGLKMSY